MSARVLVVDDLEAMRRLLEARLADEYYEVLTATRGEEAVQTAKRERPDIILMDVMMPGGIDGFEACRRIKTQPETRHIPVILVTTLDDRDSRVRGLKAGAEDFLTKPIDAVQLLARVRNLVGLKVVIDELRAREASGKKLGVIGEEHADPLDRHRLISGNVLLIDDNAHQIARIRAALGVEHCVTLLGQTEDAAAAAPDLAIVSVTAKSFDGFRVIARMRSGEATRHLPILAVVDPDSGAAIVRALELGAHDIVLRPIDEDEIAARARTLMRRKHYMDALRLRLDQSLGLAVTDPLTGLFNRRFLYAQLGPLAQRAQCGGDPVSVMVIDIDHFKRINDSYGHGAGDDVLKQFAVRFASNLRPSDYACRMGGEEFVALMANTAGDAGCVAAERLRRAICAAPFTLTARAERLDLTVSIGVACSEHADDDAEALIQRADAAMYEAKHTGRNRVVGKSARSAA